MRGSIGWLRVAALGAVIGGAACSSASPPKTDAEYERAVTTDVRSAVLGDVNRMLDAARALRDAAPLPQPNGWDSQRDADAIAAMKQAWLAAREAYEHVEAAVEPTLPDLDASLDSRYEALLARGADAYLFDDQGVVGLDAIERILYSDVTPARVIAYERALPGYVVAAFPANAQEAIDFKAKLCARLVADVESLVARWAHAELDVVAIFGGVAALVAEQRDELDAAATRAEESRYSQRPMEALRDNMEGVESIYGLYRPWLASKGGGDVDARIEDGIARVDDAYASVRGEAFPTVPAMWNGQSPSTADLQTGFGQLFTVVRDARDAQRDGALLHEVLRAAKILGL